MMIAIFANLLLLCHSQTTIGFCYMNKCNEFLNNIDVTIIKITIFKVQCLVNLLWAGINNSHGTSDQIFHLHISPDIVLKL